MPELRADEALYSLLGKRPLALVALVHFLRDVSGSSGWRPPPLRATVVFDDPNLRWRRYGFIDFRGLLEHADRHNYHAAMAMIPLDAGRVHRPTADLFRSRPDRLSLVFHGNDHLKGELLRLRDGAAALAMLAQALRRISAFERRAGLAVDRVMMPPHSLCSREAVRALAALPFDAVCGIHARPWTPEPPADPVLAGWRPAEFIGGCAVIPRIPFTSSPADIALRAFLDHPIVLYGHHDDISQGLEPLEEMVAAVNRLGDVRWMSSGDIALSNVSRRSADAVLTLRPFARRVRAPVEGGDVAVRVAAPDDADDAGALAGWSAGGDGVVALGEALTVDGEASVLVRLHARHEVDPRAVAPPPWRPWPRVRRTATEARDRVSPLLARRAA